MAEIWELAAKLLSEIARETGHDRKTIRKALRSEYLGYSTRRSQPYPAVGPFMAIIDAWLLPGDRLRQPDHGRAPDPDGRERQEQEAFTRFRGYHSFEARFCTPARPTRRAVWRGSTTRGSSCA